MSDTEKTVYKLKSIDDELTTISCTLSEINDKLLHDETLQLLRNLNQTVVVFNKWVIILAVIFIVIYLN